jgi:hypothetical protein
MWGQSPLDVAVGVGDAGGEPGVGRRARDHLTVPKSLHHLRGRQAVDLEAHEACRQVRPDRGVEARPSLSCWFSDRMRSATRLRPICRWKLTDRAGFAGSLPKLSFWLVVDSSSQRGLDHVTGAHRRRMDLVDPILPRNPSGISSKRGGSGSAFMSPRPMPRPPRAARAGGPARRRAARSLPWHRGSGPRDSAGR